MANSSCAGSRALGEARKRGVDIRILLGGHARRFLTLPAGNLLAIRFLAGLGVDCRIYSSEGEKDSHAKYFIMDRSTVVCGSHNWSPRALSRGVDTSVAVDSGNLVRGAGALFLDAWKQAQRLERTMQEIVPGVPFQSVLCDPAIYNGFRSETAPAGSISEHEGSVRLLPDGECYTALLQTIRGVRQSLRISMFFFSNPTNKKHPNYDLIGELLWAHGRGVDIRIVLDANRETDIYHSRRINTWVKDQPNRNTRGSACGSVRSSRSTTRSSWSPTGTRP